MTGGPGLSEPGGRADQSHGLFVALVVKPPAGRVTRGGELRQHHVQRQPVKPAQKFVLRTGRLGRRDPAHTDPYSRTYLRDDRLDDRYTSEPRSDDTRKG